MKLGYVVKRYPRYSETFIVREIIAHEEAGVPVEIFALRPPNDHHFQDIIARVKASVNYLYMPPLPPQSEPVPVDALVPSVFWETMQRMSETFPDFWHLLERAKGEEARNVYQASLLSFKVKQLGITHLHAPFSNQPATVCRLASLFTGVPFSFTARAKDIYHETVDHEDIRRKLEEASAVVTITQYNLRHLQNTYGEAAAKVEHIYNGLELDRLTYQEPVYRQNLIVAVGRLVPKKGFEHLINACSILREAGKQFTCVIIGAGPLQNTLQEQINRLHLGDIVRLAGPLPHVEVATLVQSAAAFTLPCIVADDGDRDGLPNVIFEAMALGTPVVSTDVTGIPEILKDNETGLMVRQRDASALASALDQLLYDVDLRVKLCRNARRLIDHDFDADRNAARRRLLFSGHRENRSVAELEDALR